MTKEQLIEQLNELIAANTLSVFAANGMRPRNQENAANKRARKAVAKIIYGLIGDKATDEEINRAVGD